MQSCGSPGMSNDGIVDMTCVNGYSQDVLFTHRTVVRTHAAVTTYWSESQMCFNIKFSYIKQKRKIRELFYPPHTIGYTLYRYVCVDTEK